MLVYDKYCLYFYWIMLNYWRPAIDSWTLSYLIKCGTLFRALFLLQFLGHYSTFKPFWNILRMKRNGLKQKKESEMEQGHNALWPGKISIAPTICLNCNIWDNIYCITFLSYLLKPSLISHFIYVWCCLIKKIYFLFTTGKK